MIIVIGYSRIHLGKDSVLRCASLLQENCMYTAKGGREELLICSLTIFNSDNLSSVVMDVCSKKDIL